MRSIPCLLLLTLISCQTQIESRSQMDEAAARTSNSIIKLIDSSLALPSLALAGTGSPIASSTSSFTPK